VLFFLQKEDTAMISNKEFFRYSRIRPAYSGRFMVYLKAIDKVCFTRSYRKAQQIVKLAKGQQIRLAKHCKKMQNWLVEDVEGGKQS